MTNSIKDFRSLFTDLPMGADAKADLIEFITNKSKALDMSSEKYVLGGRLIDDAKELLNNHAEGFAFTMEDVFMLTGN